MDLERSSQAHLQCSPRTRQAVATETQVVLEVVVVVDIVEEEGEEEAAILAAASMVVVVAVVAAVAAMKVVLVGFADLLALHRAALAPIVPSSTRLALT